MNTDRAAAVAIGAVCGILFFTFASYVVSLLTPTPLQSRGDNRYSGYIEAHDVHDNVLVMRVPSSFAGTEGSGLVQIQYDSRTVWSSITFTFADSILARRDVVMDTKPIELPKGTLVSVLLHGSASGELYAAHISYLRRNEL